MPSFLRLLSHVVCVFVSIPDQGYKLHSHDIELVKQVCFISKHNKAISVHGHGLCNKAHHDRNKTINIKPLHFIYMAVVVSEKVDIDGGY